MDYESVRQDTSRSVSGVDNTSPFVAETPGVETPPNFHNGSVYCSRRRVKVNPDASVYENAKPREEHVHPLPRFQGLHLPVVRFGRSGERGYAESS